MPEEMICFVSPHGAVRCKPAMEFRLQSVPRETREVISDAIEAAYPGKFGPNRMSFAIGLISMLNSSPKTEVELPSISMRVLGTARQLLNPETGVRTSESESSALPSIVLYNSDTLPGEVIGAWRMTRLDLSGMFVAWDKFKEPAKW